MEEEAREEHPWEVLESLDLHIQLWISRTHFIFDSWLFELSLFVALRIKPIFIIRTFFVIHFWYTFFDTPTYGKSQW